MARIHRSREYLDYVRGLPCAVCGGQAEPHHWRKDSDGGTGLKPSDCFCVPLCREHHREAHQHGDEWFAEEYNLEPWRLMAFLMRDWLVERRAA